MLRELKTGEVRTEEIEKAGSPETFLYLNFFPCPTCLSVVRLKVETDDLNGRCRRVHPPRISSFSMPFFPTFSKHWLGMVRTAWTGGKERRRWRSSGYSSWLQETKVVSFPEAEGEQVIIAVSIPSLVVPTISFCVFTHVPMVERVASSGARDDLGMAYVTLSWLLFARRRWLARDLHVLLL